MILLRSLRPVHTVTRAVLHLGVFSCKVAFSNFIGVVRSETQRLAHRESIWRFKVCASYAWPVARAGTHRH